MYIHPDIPTLLRGPDAVQFGTTPGGGIVLTELSHAEVAVLTHLPRAHSRDQVMRYARRRGLTEGDVDALIDVLCRAGVATRRRAPAARSAPYRWTSAGTAAPSLAHTSVEIGGLTPVGVRLAHLLADAGVGTLYLKDPAPVTHLDAPLLATSAPTRADATVDSLYARSVRAFTQECAYASLSVLVAGYALQARSWAGLMAAERTHLPIIVSDRCVEVGPLIRPGSTPCLHCLHLTKRDEDAAWPALNAQLRQLGPPPVDVIVGAQAAATAASVCVAALSGDVPRHSLSWVWLPDEPVPLMRQWVAHPRCSCGAAPTTAHSA